MADDIAFRCFFHITFRCGGQYGDNTSLLYPRPPPGMVRDFPDIRATAAAVFKAGGTRKRQFDILEFHGGLCSLLIAFALSFYILFKGGLQQGGNVM